MLLRRKPQKFPPVDSVPLETGWAMTESGTAEDPLFLRVNLALQPLAGHPDYPEAVYIEVPFGALDEAELGCLAMLEDVLIATLCGDRQCLPAAVVTRGDARKFLFYTSDNAATLERLRGVDADLPSHELRVGFVPDERWTAWTGFARGARRR